MYILYAYSPSFCEGWAIGVQIVVGTPVGGKEHKITGGFVSTTLLKNDAYVRASELDASISRSLTPAEIDSEDVVAFLLIVSQVSLTPSVYQWESMDGALSALKIDSGDCSMVAEWNTDYPKSWKGLKELHFELERLYEKYQ